MGSVAAIESFHLTIEEDIILNNSHTFYFTTYLVNVKSIELMGSLQHVTQCMHAFPSTIQPDQLHLETWDYWMVDDYQQIFAELVCITRGHNEASRCFDCMIDNHVHNLGG